MPDYQQTDADVEQAVAQAEQTVFLPRLKSHQTPAVSDLRAFPGFQSDWRALVKTERERFSEMLLGEASHHLQRVFM